MAKLLKLTLDLTLPAFLSHFDKVVCDTSTCFDRAVAEIASGPVSFCIILRLKFSEYGMLSSSAPDSECGIMQPNLWLRSLKVTTILTQGVTAKLTEREILRNKAISKFSYIVEQYFGISHLHDNGQRDRFTKIIKNNIDIMFRQFAFNLRKGAKILEPIPM